MKRIILKGLIQFLVSSLLVIFVLFFWLRGGGFGGMIIEIYWKGTIASVAGILVADIDLYRTKKFSILALIATAFLCRFGIYASFFISDELGGYAGLILSLLVIEVPAIVVYNLISYYSRKLSGTRF